MSAPNAANKQDLLVKCIADAVKASIEGDLKAVSLQTTAILVTLNAINARLTTVENSITGGAPAGGKRQTRAAAGGAKKPAAKAGGQKGANVTNALLFFRKAMADNLYGIRDEFATDENIAEADADASVAKVDKTKEEIYYSTVGAFLWKTVLTDAQKDEMRTKFNDWKAETTRAEADDPLEEEQ